MVLEPNYEEMMDKALGGPRRPVADNSEPTPTPEAQPIPAPEPEPENAPAPEMPEPVEEPEVDASVILMRQDYSRKMHEIGQQRRQIEAEKQRLAYLAEIDNELAQDEAKRAAFEQAYQMAQAGQAPNGTPVPAPDRALLTRISRLEQTLAEREQQAHLDTLDAASRLVAQEFGLSAKDTQAVVMKAAQAGLIDYGTPAPVVSERLRMAAAAHVLPSAKATGQRQMLDQIKDKGRVATSVAEKPAPPEPEPDVTKMKQQEYERYLISLAEKAGRGTS